jgi:D-hydroxyproline dehydrogenase subunit beta
MPEVDVVVVGSGIVGSFSAYALTRRGLRVLVLDRAGLAPGTSRASDGNLLASDHPADLGLELMRESLRLWGAMIEHLGNDCEFDRKGSLVVTRDPGQRDRLRAHVDSHRAAGVDCAYVEDGLLELEPELSPEVVAAGLWPGDAQVQPMRACWQLARFVQGQGGHYRLYDGMTGFTAGPSGVEVTLEGGERLACGHLVLATGVWTPEVLKGHGIDLPVRPRKGQICVLERGEVTIRHKIADFAYNDTIHEATDAVQTAAIIEGTQSGTILCGSSRAFAGFDRGVDQAVLGRIMRDCIAFVPRLAGLRVIRGYAGLRPWSPDGLPLIGPVEAHGRVLVATGHEGSGHGYAAVTGEIVADLVTGTPNRFTSALDPRRVLH